MSSIVSESDNTASVARSRPPNSIQRRWVEITAQSTLYQRDNSGIPTCTVVLEISFHLGRDVRIAYAEIPLDLKVCPASSSSTPRINHDCYIHAHFTGSREEAIIMESHDVDEAISMQVGVIASLGKTKKSKKPIETISLIGQRSGNNMGVRWIFCNSSPEHHYPLNVKLIVIVKKVDGSQKLGFPFALELGKEFLVSLFRRSFRDILPNFSNKSPPQPIYIAGNWETEIARKALTDAAKFYDGKETPQEIGLRAARRVCSTNTNA